MAQAVQTFRSVLADHQIECLGRPSAIIPVMLGDEAISRETAKRCYQKGVYANLVEFYVVKVGQGRLRAQAMASHTVEQAEKAAKIIAQCYQEGRSDR